MIDIALAARRGRGASMNTSTPIRRFCRAGFFEGVGRIFGSFTPAGGDPVVRERVRRPVLEVVREEWFLIGSLLWDSLTAFRTHHPEVKADPEHEQAQEAHQSAGSR
jgi:hypothetical protein